MDDAVMRERAGRKLTAWPSLLSGRVSPVSDGNRPRSWSSGSAEFAAHDRPEADDGAPIPVHNNRGIASSDAAAVAPWRDEGPHRPHMVGHHEDILGREDGQWRLAQRTIRDWSGPVLASFAGEAGEWRARALPPPLIGAIFPSAG